MVVGSTNHVGVRVAVRTADQMASLVQIHRLAMVIVEVEADIRDRLLKKRWFIGCFLFQKTANPDPA